MEPTECQREALTRIEDWFHNGDSKVFKLGGLAGTGKSSMIPWIHEHLGLGLKEVQFVAPTNKAALVVQGRLRNAGIETNARTVHKTYYTKVERHCDECPLTESLKQICHGVSGYNACGCHLDFNALMSSDHKIRLVICDESSMINREVYHDLINACEDKTKVLFVGDHGQLEAVDDNVQMQKSLGKFDLMRFPDFILKEIQRQAKGSPILQLAYQARQGTPIEYGVFGYRVSKVKMGDELDFDFKDQGIVGITYFSNVDRANKFHKGRISVADLNKIWRANLDIKSTHPTAGERLVCRDYIRRVGISKGTLGTVKELNVKDHESYHAIIELDDGREYEGLISSRQFYNTKTIWGEQHLDKWDYGYALTCHTAQGSEFESVVIFEPPAGFVKWLGPVSYSRWLYTAITRAKRHLLLVG